jgi:hypothetical protein
MLDRLFDAAIGMLSPLALVWFWSMVFPATVATLVAVLGLWGGWWLARRHHASGKSAPGGPTAPRR